MKPDNLKKVGELNGEPVYTITPAEAEELQNFDALHRTFCLPCLFDSLIDPLEELEEFAYNASSRLAEIENLPAEGEAFLQLMVEKETLVRHLSIANAGIATLQALVEFTATRL